LRLSSLTTRSDEIPSLISSSINSFTISKKNEIITKRNLFYSNSMLLIFLFDLLLHFDQDHMHQTLFTKYISINYLSNHLQPGIDIPLFIVILRIGLSKKKKTKSINQIISHSRSWKDEFNMSSIFWNIIHTKYFHPTFSGKIVFYLMDYFLHKNSLPDIAKTM
jgi:hypothetical protein